MALYSSALVMKLFNSSQKLKIITVKLKTTLLLNASLQVHLLTFVTVLLVLLNLNS